ncbi:MAG: HEAT repeat domain-containing protein [Planctomycetes bacterium]|nr:HEAT repeat domain-containing protein [Planctomycetota bacterium]
MEQRETTESLIDGLRSGDVEIRKQAIERAVHATDDEVVDHLVQLIQEPDVGQDSREAAAVALAQMPSHRGGTFLLELIGSDDPGFRGSAAVGLGHLQTEAAMSALIKALADKVNTVRNLAERSLMTMVDVVRQKGVEQLLELLNHPVPLTRSPAARAQRDGVDLAKPAQWRAEKSTTPARLREASNGTGYDDRWSCCADFRTAGFWTTDVALSAFRTSSRAVPKEQLLQLASAGHFTRRKK